MVSKPGAIIIEGHVQGLSNTRSLGEAGIPVIVVDESNCVARYSRYCSAFYKCPPFESDKFADFLIDLAIRKNLKDWILIPSNDHAVFTLSRNKKRLENKFKVITPDLEIINNIYDKSRLLTIAQLVNVPIPQTYYTDNIYLANTGLDFPVLTKGRQGLDFYRATGKKAFLANNHSELLKQLEKIAKLFPVEQTFIQELIPFDGTNKTISFTAFCEEGEIKTHWCGIKVREHPVQFGTATFAQSIKSDGVLELSSKLLKQLNYTGMCEVEYLRDPRDLEYKLIEINARSWLWVELARKCGVDFALMAYRHVNSIEQSFPASYKVNIKWINLWTDLLYSVIALLTNKLSFVNYIKSFKGKVCIAMFSKKDLFPFFVYPLFIIQFLFKR